MLRFTIVTLILLITLAFPVSGQYHSVPPSPLPLQVQLPDGSSLHLVGRGNDFFHWSETVDGYTVIRNERGYYEYAVRRGGVLTTSGIRAYDPAQRSLQHMRQLIGIPKHLSPQQEADVSAHTHTLSPLASQSSTLQAAVPSTGQLRMLAICIEYPDLPHTYTIERISRMLNEGINGKPSFRDYFLENSYGQLDIQVDVAGWYVADQNFAYYGDENGKSRTRTLVQQALREADAQVDYSNYDNDQDGDLDGIIIIHSGPGAEEGGRQEYIWSHRWTVPFASYDNTFIFDYTIQPETRSERYGGDVGIGIFCHEFGHLLGLPDLYDTNSGNGSSNGIGEWGLMGSGGWLGLEDYPAGLSAWSKERLGWITPRDITAEYGNFTLRPAHAHPDYYRIESGRDGEYFLLENRQKAGYDAYLKGEGLAIWHINSDKTSLYPSSNTVNADEELKGVDLEEADGKNDLDKRQNRGDAGDLFPGSSGRDAFNLYTNPSSDSYFPEDNSVETGVSLKNISLDESGSVTFTNSRLFSNSGDNCGRALIAFEGTNRVSESLGWYEFTMPRAGALQIDTRAAATPTHVALYLDCDAENPLQQVTSFNDQRGTQPIEIKNLPAGQKVLLHWQEVTGEPVNSFTFELRLEDRVSEQDSLALVAMYERLGGENWEKQDNWLQSPVSGWQGVRVENARVVALDLQDMGLDGTLPEAIYQLTALQKLQLAGQQLNGLLDERISALQHLQRLHLQAPLQVGFLPQLTSLTDLQLLSLKDVEADGSLPQDIGELASLEVLEIVNASLSGEIPASLGNLAQLRELRLSENRLTGTIPADMGSLWKLQQFEADQNLLSGQLPAELMGLPALVHLSLQDNLLTAVPENLLSSNTLNFIDLSRNRIQSRLPQAVARNSEVPLHLDLSQNMLKGTLSEAFTSIVFSVLDLSSNMLAEEVPALKVNTFLGLENNQFNDLAVLPDINEGSMILRLAANRFTFDDLLPNQRFLLCSSCTREAERYSPQDTLFAETRMIIREGDPVTYALTYDESVSDNQYQWYRNDTLLPDQQDKTLNLTAFDQQQEGAYACRIRNAQLPGLTLVVEGIQLELKAKEEQEITVAEITPKTFGDDDFVLQADTDSGLPLHYTRVSGPVSLDDALVSINGAGEAVIRISQDGNADYHPAEKEVRFSIAKAEQQITLEPVVGKTYGDEAFNINATASSGLPVSLKLQMGNASLSNTVLTIEGAGNVEILATQAGDANYQAASPRTLRFDVARADQKIQWNEIPEQIFGAEPIALQATSTAGLPPIYEVLDGPGLLQDRQLHITGAGTISVQAKQPGNDNYRAAAPVQQSIQVAKAPQSIFFDEIFDRELSDEPLLLEAQSDADLPVVFRVVEGPARIENGNRLFLEAEGRVTVEASQPGDHNYRAAEAIQRSFYVSLPEKQPQSIVLMSMPDTVRADQALVLDWTVSSDLEPQITVDGPAILQGRELNFTASGRVSLRFEQAGNDQYKAALPVVRELYVTKVPQSLSLSVPEEVSLSEESLQLRAESTSGLAVAFRVLQGNVSRQGNTLQLLDSGTVVIEAYQPGDDYYDAAEPLVFSFEVTLPELLGQTIQYREIGDQVFTEAPLTLDAEATSGLPLTIVAEGPVSLQGNEMHLLASGEVSIRIFQKGNESYAASDTVVIRFSVLAAPQSISFAAESLAENRYLLAAEASSGLPVSYQVISGEADLAGDTLTITGLEDVVVEAGQEGDQRYQPAESVRRTLINNRITSITTLGQAGLKAYPNPSTDIFYLNLPPSAAPTHINLYDMRGSLIRSWTPGALEIKLDLGAQASGTYRLQVVQGDQKATLRLIKE